MICLPGGRQEARVERLHKALPKAAGERLQLRLPAAGQSLLHHLHHGSVSFSNQSTT